MTMTERLVTVGVVVLGTMITRFLPFLLFPADKPTPKHIRYLGKMLPSAALGLLVIYCFRNVSVFTGHHAAPELVSALAIILLHVWRRQMLLSIAGGTILYMLLVQLVF